MKTKHYTHFVPVLLFVLVIFYTKSDAAQVFGRVQGEQVRYDYSCDGGITIDITAKCLFVAENYGNSYNSRRERVCAPEGDEIVSQTVCRRANRGDFIVTLLLKSGGIIVYNATGDYTINQNFAAPLFGGQPILEITGDALYERSYNYVAKSTDSGQTWVVDTLGLNGTFLHSMCTDTFQKVYIGSNLGLFMQDGNSNRWVLNANFPDTYCGLVYTDRRNRLFAVGLGNILYSSADTGISFQFDTTGLGNLGLRQITALGDDSLGNIYVIVDKKQIYRSIGGSHAFVRIDQSLSALNDDSLYINPFNSITGNSVLFVATAFGSFYSNDQGNTWFANNSAISAQSFYGLVEANNGKKLLTTNLACFSATDNTDTAWVKVYPEYGYTGGRPLYKDNSGTLYTQGGTISSDINFQTRMVVKSTDNGATWLSDTLGISQAIFATWFVDETGTQHGSQWGSNSAPTQLFSKAPGQSWATDNAGFTGDSAIPIGFGSNGNGKIYYSGNYGAPILYSKQGAGNWAPDTAGLAGATGIYDYAHNSSGNMYLGAYSGIWKQTGVSWAQLNNPPSVSSTSSAFAIAVDASNTIWAAFSYFDINYNSVGLGVYYTNDDGVTWHKPSFDIDTVTFLHLVAIGDSVYGLSYYNGAYLFDKNGPSSVIPADKERSGIRLFPNPANGLCNLQLSANFEMSSASVLDITGREVQSLYNDQQVSSFNFNTERLPCGLYFVKVSDNKGHTAVC